MISAGYIIHTDRLLIREFEVADGCNFYRLNNDPEVLKYTGDLPFKDIEEAENLIRHYSNYERDGFGRWTVVIKETGDIAGWCGLKYHPEFDYVDLGYRFHKKYWGSGIATEASKACVQRGFDEFNIPVIIGRTAKANIPSIKVLEKIGMSFWKEAPCEGINDSVYYRILKP